MFTPYYILAVSFGVFAVLVSVVGIKRANSFPGPLFAPIILVGVAFAVATLGFCWHAADKEEAEKKAEHSSEAKDTAAKQLPAGVKHAS